MANCDFKLSLDLFPFKLTFSESKNSNKLTFDHRQLD